MPERRPAQNHSDEPLHRALWHLDVRYNTTIPSDRDAQPHPGESEWVGEALLEASNLLRAIEPMSKQFLESYRRKTGVQKRSGQAKTSFSLFSSDLCIFPWCQI